MAEKPFQQHDKIEKIEQVEKVANTSPQLEIEATEETSAPSKVKFEQALERADSKWAEAMQRKEVVLVANDEKSSSLSPIAELSMNEKRIDRIKPVTVDQIVEQSDDTRGKLSSAISKVEETQKTTPDLRLTPAHDAILTDKLIHIDSSLKTSLAKVGVEVKATEIAPTTNPLVKYLNYLTNSDKQMSTLVGEIQGLNATKSRLRPDQLLALQIKLNYVQQQIEFFTNVLNKAVEGTKTIMNVQV